MRLERSTTRTFRFGLAAVAALTFSIALAIGSTFTARAQDDAPANAVDAQSDADQPAQSGTDDWSRRPSPTPPSRRTTRRMQHKRCSTTRRRRAIS